MLREEPAARGDNRAPGVKKSIHVLRFKPRAEPAWDKSLNEEPGLLGCVETGIALSTTGEIHCVD